MTARGAAARRVAMVVFSYYPADPRVRREAEALGRAGMEVDVICLKKAGESAFERFGGVSAYRVMRGTEKKEGIFAYLLLSSLFGAVAFMKLAALSFRRGYCLVQAHNLPDFLVFTGVLQKAMGAPVVLDLHDLTVELFRSKTAGSALRRLEPAVRVAERLSCAFADSVITTSGGFRERLIGRGIPDSKITLVLNSADDSIFRVLPRRACPDANRADAGPALLYHGTVARRFGIHVALEAVSMLRKRYPRVRLRVFGKYDPSYRDELKAMASESALAGSVEILGFLTLEEVIEEIKRSDIGVVPYLSDEFMNLALSTKIFEYVSTGLPVVASRLDSIRSVFSDASLKYFSPGSAADLAAKLEELLERPAERERQARSALAEYAALSWPVMSERYVGTIEGLLRKAS